MQKRSFFYGKHKIDYIIKRKKVKNINLVIYNDLTVVVSANNKVTVQYIQEFLDKKAKWIFEKLEYFKQNKSVKIEKEYVSGETFRYLGKQYRLKVFEDSKNYIKFYRGHIHLYVKNRSDIDLKKKLISYWYKDKAEEKFDILLDKMSIKMQKYGISKPKMRLRKMKTRWGSCLINKNEIILNSELIKADKFCIEYVILHELIHFKFAHHDNDFYNMLDILMPDWRSRKNTLDTEIAKEL